MHLQRDIPLNDAAVKVLGEEQGLGPEHVRRVIEFANNDTFQGKFEQENGDHRIINIEGGPADPSDVLKELNMGATAAPMKTPTAFGDLFDEEFVPGQDSAEGVFDTEKEASAAVDIPHANPHGDLVRLRDHLVAARDNVLSKLAMAEVSYEDIGSRLYQEAKQLVLSGRSPAEVAGALIAAGDGSPMTKEALSLISDRMEREAIPAVETTISKLAANRLVNMRHPLVQTFADFVKIAEARYSLVDQKSIIDEQLGRVNGALMEVMK